MKGRRPVVENNSGDNHSTANDELNVYKQNLIKEAEKIILEKFPKKILEFNELLERHDFSYERLQELLPDPNEIIPVPLTQLNDKDGQPEAKRARVVPFKSEIAGTPVYGFPSGTVKCNLKLAELTDATKPLLREAVEDVNKLKLWITFLIPRIEDGNNFGVSIQEEALNEVRTVESEAASFLDQMSRYFVSRARLVTKIAKYPHVDDYRRAILDMDEKQFINIRLVLMETRNHLATLHDMITKNLEKIKKPRSTEHVLNMY
jgi:proteasome activator subunit 3 (PA28 gamma)